MAHERRLQIRDAVEMHRPEGVVDGDRGKVALVPGNHMYAGETRPLRLEPEPGRRVVVTAGHENFGSGIADVPKRLR